MNKQTWKAEWRKIRLIARKIFERRLKKGNPGDYVTVLYWRKGRVTEFSFKY